MRYFRFVFFVFSLNSTTRFFSQTNVMCTYAGSIDENYNEIINTLNTSVVLRDSLSFTIRDGKTIQNDTSKIILPDSCTLVLLYDIKYAFISKPGLNYLLVIDKLGSFGDNMTNNYLFEVVQELSLTTAFINLLGDHPELKNIDSQFFSVIEFSAPDSEYILSIKKWIKRNPVKKELEFYKRINSALDSKKNAKTR